MKAAAAAACAAIAAAGLAGCHDRGAMAYKWDGSSVVCSRIVDDYEEPLHWTAIDQEMAAAEANGWAMLYHAHTPGQTVTRETIEHLFDLADRHHLAYVTFRELGIGPARPAIVFAFDDAAVDAWMSMRDVVRAHHATITLFVSRWFELGAAQKAELAQLAADGDDVEPHTVNHLHAREYVAQHGLDAYIRDEVLPSVAVLTAAGYPPPASFAYPFGDHSPEIDRAVLAATGARTVRTTASQCHPHAQP